MTKRKPNLRVNILKRFTVFLLSTVFISLYCYKHHTKYNTNDKVVENKDLCVLSYRIEGRQHLGDILEGYTIRKLSGQPTPDEHTPQRTPTM